VRPSQHSHFTALRHTKATFIPQVFRMVDHTSSITCHYLSVFMTLPNYSAFWQGHTVWKIRYSPMPQLESKLLTSRLLCMIVLIIIKPNTAQKFNTIFNSTLRMWATKCKKLVGHDPAEISIFNSLKNPQKLQQQYAHIHKTNVLKIIQN